MNDENTKPGGEQYEEIDLVEILYLFLRNWKILLASLLVGALIAGLVTVFLITPQYTASSMVYIFSKTTSITSLTDLQIGSQLTVDFKTLATSRPVVEKVIEELNLNATYESFVQTVTVENPTNSRILRLYVENPDPQLAADISNSLANALCDRVAEVMSTDRPSSVETAVPPPRPSSPNKTRNVMIGGALGFALAAAVVLIRFFMDDSIKSTDDILKYLSLNTLAEIPMEHAAGETKKKRFGFGKKSKPVARSATQPGKISRSH